MTHCNTLRPACDVRVASHAACNAETAAAVLGGTRSTHQISLSEEGFVESRLDVPAVHAIRSSTVICVQARVSGCVRVQARVSECVRACVRA